MNTADFLNNFREGALSATALTQACLARAKAAAPLNALLHVSTEAALARATELDAKRQAGGSLGALAGVPIAIKDALCTLDAPTTAASKILTRDGKTYATGWRPPYDATVVKRLRDADALLIGKANMDEFAMGSSNENSAFGPVKNPWDLTRTPGGSSGGSAAAVAARTVPAALGSDTGGSIRQPASHCGVVGVKPSYGRVSRYGLIAFASSLDQVGPLTSDVDGAARVLEVIAGADPLDATCVDAPAGNYVRACQVDLPKLRVGVPQQYFAAGLDDSVRHAVEKVIDHYRSHGAEIVSVSLPHTDYGVSTYYLIATAEASSNLSRFDGVRFGLRVEDGDLTSLYEKSRGLGFGAEVKRRIMLGTYALSAGFYDAYYRKAQQVRTLIREDFDRAFTQVDLLVTPSSPTPAFRLGEKVQDPLQMYLADIYTLPASLAGICGLSLPAGFVETDGAQLPIGVQLLAPHFAEERLFTAAAHWERTAALAHLAPPGFGA
ncbi:MAG: glutamyl-tRNA(Gln) amidotransferase [Pseudomonadota bacterium]|jgi:aspartyl-tRNA(Asn)/glutamyl-tRNA(Gln) amidotransferase subunit A